MGFYIVRNECFYFSNKFNKQPFEEVNTITASESLSKLDANAEPFIPKASLIEPKTDIEFPQHKVKLHQTIRNPPGDTIHAKVQLNTKLVNKDVMFTPKNHPKLQLEEAVYAVQIEEKENLKKEKAESLTRELYNIYIPIQNISEDEILLIKDQNLGHLELIEDTKENIEVESTEQTVNSQESLETVNLITPTIDTINRRKEE